MPVSNGGSVMTRTAPRRSLARPVARVAAPQKVLPRHVLACQHSPTQAERWFVHTWKRDSGGDVQTRIPYSCNSWRCEVCRRHEAAVTFARIRDATAPLPADGWCFFVLTLDRDGYFSGKPWADVTDAYRKLGKMSAAFLSGVGRRWGPDTRVVGKKRPRVVRRLGNRWVAVVEAHRSGWPHVNLLVYCPELAAELRAEREERLHDPDLANAVALAADAWKSGEPIPATVRELARGATRIGGELRALAEQCGWGRESTAEAARSSEAVAGYVVKLAGKHDASAGELAKITQAPLNAPARFRRLRSGKGFLPPRHCNPEITGCLVRRRRAGYDARHQWRKAGGDWEVLAINPPKDEAQLPAVERARAVELQLIEEEENILSRQRGKLPAMPPMRLAIRGKLEGHKETSERREALRSRGLAACG